jgi:AraC family transcriptional regulator
MGISVSSYIQSKKIETAQNMLCHSDYAISVISTTLAFPSQSYFTSVFREKTGKTPTQYRAEHFRTSGIQ